MRPNSGTAAHRVLVGDGSAVRVEQAHRVLADGGEGVGLAHADDSECGDPGQQQHRRDHQERARAPASGRLPGLSLRLRCGHGCGRQVERRVLGEDPFVQPAQLGAGLDADLLHERRARLPIRLQRLGLPPGAVEREHPLAVKAFTQRVLGDQPVELAGQLGVAPGRQVGVNRHLGGAQAQVLEAPDLGSGERLVGKVRQRLTPPQRQRVARP